MTVGFAEVEQQLRRLRGRLNIVALQHAAYVIGSVAALGAAISMVSAARGSPMASRVVVWMTLVGVALSAVLSAASCRRCWMSIQTTARFADTRSQLDDRLATIHAYRHRAQPPSRLAGILLTQALALKPRWDVPAIAPRRFPRSVYALLVSLCALAFAWQLEPLSPPEAAPGSKSAPTIEPHSQASNPSDVPARYPQPVAAGPQSGDEGEGAGESDGGAEMQTGGSKGDSAKSEGTSFREGNPSLSTARRYGGEKGAANAGEPDQLQRADRNANGGESRSSENHASPGPRSAGLERERDADGSSKGENLFARQTEPKDSKASADNPQRRPAQQQSQQADSKTAAGQPQTALSSGGSAAARQTTGTSGQGLLAEPQPSQRLSGELRKFALKLTAFSSVESSQSEPQPKPKRGEVSDVGTPASDPSAPQLSERDVPDDPLHRAEIAPEHEAIVRSVFQRE